MASVAQRSILTKTTSCFPARRGSSPHRSEPRQADPQDYGKMAATFVDVARGAAMRLVARDDARALVAAWAPGESDPRRAQITAYRVVPEESLLRCEPVSVVPGWLDRPRARVLCDASREGINHRREAVVNARVLCRPCAGEESYYTS